jgi:hypothetical protein
MIDSMEHEPPKDDQSQYDIFRQDSSLETIEVAEENSSGSGQGDSPRLKRPRNYRKLRRRLLATLLIIIVLAGAGTTIAMLSRPGKQQGPTVVINTQSLDNGTLNQLTPQGDGQAKQQLTISPDTIFKSNVTVQGSTELVKDLSVSGKVNVQGDSNISGNLSVGKSLSVGSNLTVNGLITAASLNVGSLTLSSINLSSNLVFGGHLVPSGNAPSGRASSASAGGSVSIEGNDTAGTITITTGSGGLIPGEMAVITFKTMFNGTPKVQLTPLNSAASGLRYYATHTASFFTLNTSVAPTGNTTYIFDYLVTQ